MFSRLLHLLRPSPPVGSAPTPADDLRTRPTPFGEMERRISQLLLAAEVARDTAALSEVGVTLDRVVNLVGDRFGFYYAGIYLIDENREYAVLKSATGEAGQRMIHAGHRLKVGAEGMVGFVTASGQHRVAHDVGADQFHLKNPLLPGTRSELALPLKAGSLVIGALDVQSKASHAFGEEDIRILQTLADQLAIAIENARLFEATKRQLGELGVVHAVASAASGLTDEDALITRATQIIYAALGPYNFGVLLLDEASQTLRYHPSYQEDIQIPHDPMLMGVGIVGMVAQTGQPCLVKDVDQHPQYLSADPKVRSELCLPIRSGDRLIGVINAESDKIDHFTELDQRLLTTVAGLLASSIENMRLFHAAERRAAELEALRMASLQVTSSLDLQAVLHAILEQALQLVKAHTAHIFLYDGKQLTFGTAIWASGEELQPFDHPNPQGLTYTVARTGKGIAVGDTSKHPLFTDRSWNGAVIGLPLRHGDSVIGVMNLSFSDGPHVFEKNELHVLELLADQAAIAMSNANVYSAARQQTQTLTTELAQRDELVRLKNEFIQNVSHELRTPLAIERGYIELLERGELGELASEQRDALAVLNRRNNYLIKLVDDLVAILEAEALDLRQETINLNELVQRLVADFSPAATQAQVSLLVDLEPGPIYVRGTAAHLMRVFDNLVHNALKFTPAQGNIHISLKKNKEQVLFQIQDNGIGIPAEKLDRIFERFYQADGSTKRRYGGTGLGLSLVKEITEAHGGSVHVESEVDLGSTFTVTLPLWIKETTSAGQG